MNDKTQRLGGLTWPRRAYIGRTPLNCGNSHCGPHVVCEYYAGSWLLCALDVASRACNRDRNRKEEKGKRENGWMKREQGAVHSSACDPNPRVHSTSGSRARTYSKIVPLSPLGRTKNCPDELRGTCARPLVGSVETRPSGVKLGVCSSTTINDVYPHTDFLAWYHYSWIFNLFSGTFFERGIFLNGCVN